MNYTPVKPEKLGIQIISDIDIAVISRYIQWKFFFSAWKLAGNYDGIETACNCMACRTKWLMNFDVNEREKATQALNIFRDAQSMLNKFKATKQIEINAIVAIYSASSNGDDILVNAYNKTVCLPMMRQQIANEHGYCLSLADFIAPDNDYLGFFACSISGSDSTIEHYNKNNDTYNSLLSQSLCDRLAEATAEWLHEQIRKRYWGFASTEKLDIKQMQKGLSQGIRPAVGYPSMPDQSLIFEINKLLPLQDIGINLTENGAMRPNASVCGLVFAHPEARYFIISDISKEQLRDYAKRRGMNYAEIKRFISVNVL